MRSAIAVPRAPLAIPPWSRATVAGAANPSNDPEIVSLRPASVAVAEPFPVTLGRSAAVVGTHPSRAVYVSFWADAWAGNARATRAIATIRKLRVIVYLGTGPYLTMLPCNVGRVLLSRPAGSEMQDPAYTPKGTR